MDEKLAYRMDRSAERILGNESLTAYLDDDTADILIDWGLICAQKIVQRTDGMEDSEAEEAMYGPMRATRRLMRAVNRWVANRESLSAEEQEALLSDIIAQAGIIYGNDYSPPTPNQQKAFLREIRPGEVNATKTIQTLRQFVENINLQ